MPRVKASFSKHQSPGWYAHLRTPTTRALCARRLPPRSCVLNTHPPWVGCSAEPAAPCNALVAGHFVGVMQPRCRAGIPSGFGSVAAALRAFPPLVRCEGVLRSIMRANVMVLIKCNSWEADFLRIGQDVEPCGYYLNRLGSMAYC